MLRYAGAAGAVLSGHRKVYYGWWLLAGSVIAIALGSGVSIFSFGLYVDPLETEFGWSRGEISFGFSLALLTSGVASPLTGRWIDRYGPRSAIVCGSAVVALSYFLLATTDALWQWYAYWALCGFARQLMFFIPFQALMSRWFDRRRGLAVSLLGSGFSMGGFLVVPLMGVIIGAAGWRGGFVCSGAVVALVFIPLGILLVRNTPADIDTFIDGEVPAGKGRRARPLTGLTLGAAAHTAIFWTLALGLAFYLFASFGWIVHQIPYYESRGLSRGAATAIVSLVAAGGIISRLTTGYIADRIPRFERAVMVLALVQMSAMGTLLLTSNNAGLAVFIVLFVIGSGAGPIMETMLLTRAFGVAHFGMILSAIVLIETVGQIISPVMAGAIFDSTGSYDRALAMFFCTYAIAAVLFFVAARLPLPEIGERGTARDEITTLPAAPS